jgi:Zn-dependent protease with chaperone function
MPTDFFELQERARRRTGRLVILFVVAVVAIIVSVYIVVAGVLLFLGPKGLLGDASPMRLMVDPRLVGIISGATLSIVFCGSVYRIATLRAGGRAVAESMRGRLVTPDTARPDDRKLLNVVEEMAIASGMPSPPVYVMDHEPGINAFAAGFSPGDAAIGVTRGCVEQLDRDELQGVIAHEFSHIANGDMRLNIRLVGMLHGILVIGMLGYMIMRIGGVGRRAREAGLAILALGAGLAAIGFVGTFFGNMIKASVSRQREYLADASAIQFTRHPGGLAGALKRIGGFTARSIMLSGRAPQYSHMFFARGVGAGMHSIFATHPPLERRILRLDPGWDGRFVTGRPDLPARATRAATDDQAQPHRPGRMMTAVVVGAGAIATPPAIDTIGHPGPAHLERARELLESLPGSLVDAARDAYGARAVVYAILVNRDAETRGQQLARLAAQAEPGISALVSDLLPVTDALATEQRLPLIEKVIAPLRQLSRRQYETFRALVAALIEADDRLELLEWTLQRIVISHLDVHHGLARSPRVRSYGLDRLRTECETILSILAYVGHDSAEAAERAFRRAASRLSLSGMTRRPMDACALETLDAAIATLATVAPRVKKLVVAACAACVAADQEVTAREAEILRAICDGLGASMPPLLPGQRLA